MAYTAAQQAKLTAAQLRLDNAKDAYKEATRQYNDNAAIAMHCYGHETFYGISYVERGEWKPNTKNCIGSSPIKDKGCSQSDKDQCQNFVGQLNSTFIPNLIAAYTERNNAQSNFDKVLGEVTLESKNDPTFITEHDKEVAAAIEAEKIKKYKYFFYIVLVLVIGFGIFAYFKWGKKKAA